MINNRNKSVVKDMKWSNDGSRICIVYEDGAIIVGSVEGSRLRGKDVEYNLALIEWSPDNKTILFGTSKGEVRIFDNVGNELNNMMIQCIDEPSPLA